MPNVYKPNGGALTYGPLPGGGQARAGEGRRGQVIGGTRTLVSGITVS